MTRYFLAILSVVAVLFSSSAHASDPYLDSTLAAVESANAQAILFLDKGRYTAEAGGTRMTLEIPNDMASHFRFLLTNRTIDSASWEFDQTVVLFLRRGGLCARLEGTKIAYRTGGIFEPAGSNFKLVKIQHVPAAASCNDSGPRSAIDDVLSLNTTDLVAFFEGKIFDAFDDVRKCANADCSNTTAGQPIHRARFFGEQSPNGDLSAFGVSFRTGSKIILPGSGSITLGDGTKASFSQLDYFLDVNQGKAKLDDFDIALTAGIIASGDTVLQFESGTELKGSSVYINQGSDRFEMRIGGIDGTLGKGTVISYGQSTTNRSVVNLLSAHANLAGINYTDGAQGVSLSILRGTIDSRIESADLWLTSLTNIRLGYAGFNLVLGCPASSPPTCIAATWENNHATVKGQILGFTAKVDGGQFPLSEAGTTRIARGQIDADVLQLDSSDPVTPIAGLIKTFDADFDADDLHFDNDTTVSAAHIALQSSGLTFKLGQRLPIGLLKLDGTVQSITGGLLGQIKFVSAEAHLKLERRDGASPELTGGISAHTRVQLEGGSFATGTIELADLRYHDGFGNAELTLTVDKGSQYTWATPGGHSTQDSIAAKVDIDLKSIPITFRLRDDFVVGPLDMKASGGQWSIAPATNIPLRLSVHIDPQELIYAPVKDKIVGGTLCAPKVNLLGQDTRLDASVDLSLSSTSGKVVVSNGILAEGVSASADDRDCQYVAGLICGAAGSIAGPVGAVAMGLLCRNRLEDAEAELGDKIRDGSLEYVQKFRYETHY